MTALMVLAQIVYDPGCRELEEDSWLWWFKGCWVFATSPEVAAGVMTAGLVAGLMWSAYKAAEIEANRP